MSLDQTLWTRTLLSPSLSHVSTHGKYRREMRVWFQQCRRYSRCFIFQSLLFDVPRSVTGLLLLNKKSDETCEKIMKNLDLKSLEYRFVLENLPSKLK